MKANQLEKAVSREILYGGTIKEWTVYDRFVNAKNEVEAFNKVMTNVLGYTPAEDVRDLINMGLAEVMETNYYDSELNKKFNYYVCFKQYEFIN